LPHEQAAAALVNCHLHVDAGTRQIRDLVIRLRAQRAAARDATQSARYRAQWAEAAAASLAEIATYRRRRQPALRASLPAPGRSRLMRAALDATPTAAHTVPIAA